MARLTAKKLKKVYLPDDDDKAWVEIKYLKPGVINMIDSLSNDITATGSTGEMETTIAFNQAKKRRLFYEEVIYSWGGFMDKAGRELKPTMKNVMFFDKELGNLYTWLQEESDNFIAEVEAEAETEREN